MDNYVQPIIEFKDFSFKYRAQIEPTLKNINLKIYPGEKILVIGPSGSGKSTLANCINGLVPHTYTGDMTGDVTICGKSTKDMSIFEISKSVGTVLQDTDGQFIGLTVAEDIAFALENNCIPQESMIETVNAVADMVEVKSLLENAPGKLSGGQKQRVSMAGVMVGDEEILLFDEPLANLDPATGKTAMELIHRINKGINNSGQVQEDASPRTVIVIEHRLEDALYCDADRIIVVDHGEITADMTPDELLCTDVLEKAGVREPLYVTALKCAGVSLHPEDEPAQISTLHMDRFVGRVRDWYESQPNPQPETEAETVLEARGISFSYDGKKKILDDISFSVHRGELMAIVGKNGAGKSTLSNLICGFLTPSAGEILLNGQDISPLSIKERGEHIGMVMQNPNQMISKAMIYEEVALGLQVRGVPEEEIKERVYETLKICGLYPFRNWPINALSFGQKKRVTIAAILVLQPEIIILDEPTAGQDYRHYTEIMEFIKEINEKSGTTIIMITHDMHLMLEYTSRAVVIADGKLLADSKPAAVLTDTQISAKAYLKRTSLYDMAVSCGIEDADSFTEAFIRYERTQSRNRHLGEVNDGT